MVEIVQGDLFDADVAALVNPVHCAGLMKRGLCRQFKARFPDNFNQYKAACEAGALAPGDVLVHDRGGLFGEAQRPRYILNVATKDHWRDASSAAHIESGMASIVEELKGRALSSVAVPALGCGGGGLDWTTVRPLLTASLDALDDVRALVYAPRSEAVETGSAAATPPAMTQGRALLLRVFDAFTGPDRVLGAHTAHNLAFLLQEAGQSLHLTFEPAPHGVRATGLTAVLRRIDGHFITDFDPSHQNASVRLRRSAIEAAQDLLAGSPEATAPVEQVRTLIEDLGASQLELLATVGWIMTHDAQARRRPEGTVRAVQDWGRRTAERFATESITAAWQRLHRHGWSSTDRAADPE